MALNTERSKVESSDNLQASMRTDLPFYSYGAIRFNARVRVRMLRRKLMIDEKDKKVCAEESEKVKEDSKKVEQKKQEKQEKPPISPEWTLFSR